MAEEKIKNQKEIVGVVKKLKNQGKKIVTFSGSFDILHSGHIKALQEAKKQGDVLVVLLNSDKSIRGYKGPGHPINSQKDRAQLLSILEMVDYILYFDEIIPNKVLSKIKPDIHCNGSDWGRDCVEKETVEKGGGRIHVLKWNKDFSTTGLIKKILAFYSKSEIKAIFLNKQEAVDPNILSALKKLSESNYKIITLTNKSGINLLKKSAREFGLNLSKSWVIAAEEKDVIMGKMTNAKTIMVGKKSKIKPNYYVKDLLEAVKVILSS